MKDTDLFTLLPKNSRARDLVSANRRYRDKFQGVHCLTFKAGHQSKYPGHLLSIGQLHAICDITTTMSCVSQIQCHFALARGGDLVLSDATTGHHTSLYVYNESGPISELRMQGDPRRRVIPRAAFRRVLIRFGKAVEFEFVWRIPLGSEKQAELAKIGCENHDRTGGMCLSVPRDPNLPATAYEKETALTPRTPRELCGKPIRQIHAYKVLGQGAFGTVSQAVDLGTGELFAVKEAIQPPGRANGEDWKLMSKREVEKIAAFQHDNIVRLHHHQGWVPNAKVQLFFQLCEGHLESLLLAPHRCRERQSNDYPWFLDFVDQILSALAFMHRNGVIHRDLKPQNILYDHPGGRKARRFYISDFGLAASERTVTGIAGTMVYMAPETTRYGQVGVESDVYAFGLILLEVVGKWCPDEAGPNFTERDWRQKLRAFGVRRPEEYRDEGFRGAAVPEVQAVHFRIQSLVDGGFLRPNLARTLRQDPTERATASEARNGILSDYEGVEVDALPPGKVPASPGFQREPLGRRMEMPIRQRFA